jgi:hypothetical protein
MPAKRRPKSPNGIDVAVGRNVRFSAKRHQFDNATPLARAALLNGPPRLVAEDEHRVAIVFSAPKDGLRPRLESARLHALIRELRLPELEPYPPPRTPAFLGPPGIRVTSGPSKLPAEGGQRRSK